MKKTEFLTRVKEAVHVGDVLNNPGGGTSVIEEVEDGRIVYKRGRSRYSLAMDDFWQMVNAFDGKTVSTNDMRALLPAGFGGADGGYASNGTFSLSVLDKMGLLKGGIQGGERPGLPFFAMLSDADAAAEKPAAGQKTEAPVQKEAKPAAKKAAPKAAGDAVTGVFTSVTGAPLEKRIWLPKGEPRAVIQLVHGMAEHISRYDATAKRLTEEGFVVVGHTCLGHGEKAETLGWFAARDGWDAMIEDVNTLRRETQQTYPGVPYFLLGHSMGSFVVRGYSLKYEKGLAGIILSGTGHFDWPILNLALFLSNVQCFFGLGKKPGKLVNKISFAGYNRDWAPPRTAFDWLTRDTAIVDKYAADPYCGFPFTGAGYRDLFRGLKRLYPKYLSAMEKDVPVRLFSGAADPVGKKGEGVKTTMKELLDAGVEDVSLKLYDDGRHEMLNDTERETVWNDLIQWINDYLPAR